MIFWIEHTNMTLFSLMIFAPHGIMIIPSFIENRRSKQKWSIKHMVKDKTYFILIALLMILLTGFFIILEKNTLHSQPFLTIFTSESLQVLALAISLLMSFASLIQYLSLNFFSQSAAIGKHNKLQFFFRIASILVAVGCLVFFILSFE